MFKRYVIVIPPLHPESPMPQAGHLDALTAGIAEADAKLKDFAAFLKSYNLR